MDRGATAGSSGDWRQQVEVAYRLHAARLCELLRDGYGTQQVEDAMQDVFSRLLRGPRPRGDSPAIVLSLPYLIVCVRHAVQRGAHRAHLAASRLRRATATGQLHPREVQSAESAPGPSVEPHERIGQLARAIARLSEAEREAIYASTGAVVGEDGSADRLGCTANCAAVRRHRAIARLRQFMGAMP